MSATAPGEPLPDEPVSDADVLLRLHNNIKLRALKAGDRARALAIAERMALIAPARAEMWIDLAHLHEAGGSLGAAKQAYETCLTLAQPGADPAQRSRAGPGRPQAPAQLDRQEFFSHEPHRRNPDGSDRQDRHRRRLRPLHWRWKRRRAATRCSTTARAISPFATASVTARARPLTVRAVKGDHFTLGDRSGHRSQQGRCRADAPGPALRHGLHHGHPYS